VWFPAIRSIGGDAKKCKSPKLNLERIDRATRTRFGRCSSARPRCWPASYVRDEIEESLQRGA
jgi:hypothetical protein